MIFRAMLVAILGTVAAGQANAAYVLGVAPEISTINLVSGEAQSTVVPPGKKSQCPNGRFLVTRDDRTLLRLPPGDGLVVGRNLGDPSHTNILARFIRAPSLIHPHPEWYVLSVDPDLVTLSNGDVLYLGHTRSRVPITPKPAWFDASYKFFQHGDDLHPDWRPDWGPGARSIVMVWRSTDCGETFHYLSEMDPARYEDGSCALPQMPPGGTPYTNPPGSSDHPIFNMGGGDGPLTKVDPSNDRVYIVFQCVGNVPDTSHSYFSLSTTRLNKTLLVVSYDRGSTWTSLGFIEHRARWRFGIMPLADDRLVFGYFNDFFFGTKNGATYQFDSATQGAPEPYGWDQSVGGYFAQNPVLSDIRAKYVGGNLLAHTIIARSPSPNEFVLLFPDTVTDNSGKQSHGFRMYFVNESTKKFAEADPIMPEDHTTNSFLMHPVMIDFGTGPLLLYWTDVNGDTEKATVRGRAIYGSILRKPYSEDFQISRVGGTQYNWNITNNSQAPYAYWYGDYQTAGGFAVKSSAARGVIIAGKRYRYFPMWVQSDGSIRYSQVTIVDSPSLPLSSRTKIRPPKTILPQRWRPGPPPIEAINRKLNPQEQLSVEYGRIKWEAEGKAKKTIPAISPVRPLKRKIKPGVIKPKDIVPRKLP